MRLEVDDENEEKADVPGFGIILESSYEFASFDRIRITVHNSIRQY